MSKKQEFIDYVKTLMDVVNDCQECPEMPMTENVKLYWEAFCGTNDEEKPMFTENGKIILKFLQEHTNTPMWKAKDIAEELFISSRTVSGSMRKLVNDDFVEKVGQDPVIYSITEKGKNIKIEEN